MRLWRLHGRCNSVASDVGIGKPAKDHITPAFVAVALSTLASVLVRLPLC